METEREVIITHYINPNSFWIKFEETSPELDDFDQQIQRAVTTKLANLLSCKFIPVAGERCAAQMNPNTWVRGIIKSVILDEKEQIDTCIIWGFDHGIEFTVKKKQIRELPLKFQGEEFNFVSHAGLNLIGIIKSFNIYTQQIEYLKNDWTDAGLTTISDAIKFGGKLFFIHETTKNGQLFGQLEIITGTGVKVNINDILIRFDAGRKFEFDDGVDQFERYYKEKDSFNDTCSDFEFDSVSQIGDSSMTKYRTGEYKLQKKKVKKTEEVKKHQLYPAGFDIRRIVNPNQKF